MARGRGQQEHLAGNIKANGQREVEGVMRDTWKRTALCSDQYTYQICFSEDAPVSYKDGRYGSGSFARFPWAHDVCSRCQAIYYERWIKANPSKVKFSLGDRIDLSGDNQPYGLSKWTWKSVYPVYDKAMLVDRDEKDKAIVGFICIQNGWGHTWEIHGWKAASIYMRDADKPESEMDYTPSMGEIASMYEHESNYSSDDVFFTTDVIKTYESGGETRKFKTEAKRFPSKEYALLNFIPHMVAEGMLKSYMDCVDEATGYRAAEKARAAERAIEAEQRTRDREARQAQDEIDKGHMAEALLSLLEKANNFEREGLFLAAKKLGIDLTTKPESAPAVADDDDWSFS